MKIARTTAHTLRVPFQFPLYATVKGVAMTV